MLNKCKQKETQFAIQNKSFFCIVCNVLIHDKDLKNTQDVCVRFVWTCQLINIVTPDACFISSTPKKCLKFELMSTHSLRNFEGVLLNFWKLLNIFLHVSFLNLIFISEMCTFQTVCWLT